MCYSSVTHVTYMLARSARQQVGGTRSYFHVFHKNKSHDRLHHHDRIAFYQTDCVHFVYLLHVQHRRVARAGDFVVIQLGVSVVLDCHTGRCRLWWEKVVAPSGQFHRRYHAVESAPHWACRAGRQKFRRKRRPEV